MIEMTRARAVQSLSSLADSPEIVGFFSYSRDDDNDSMGALSALRNRIQRELRGRLGRSKANFRLWQDTAAIPQGALWEDEIKSAVAQSAFFIPIITPTTVKSLHCKKEFELFLAREAELGRRDLIFPLLYIRVPELEDEKYWRQDDVLRIIGTRQYMDWQDRRYLDVSSPEVARQIGIFCSNIYDALRQPTGALGAPAQGGSSRRMPELGVRGSVDDERDASEAGYLRSRERESSAPVPSRPDSIFQGTLKTSLLFGLAVLVGGLGVAVIALWNQNATPVAPSPSPPPPVSSQAPPAAPPPAAPPTLAEAPPPPPEFVVRKSSAFGGKGGEPFDDTGANPKHLPISGLNITVTQNPADPKQKVIGRLQVQWGDTIGPLHGGGPANFPSPPVQFAPGETITRVFIFYMTYTWARNEVPPVWVGGLQVHTNRGFYNFGNTDGPANECALSSGEKVVGFFGRSGSYVDQLGCIVAKVK